MSIISIRGYKIYYKEYNIFKGELSPFLGLFVLIIFVFYDKYIYIIAPYCIITGIYGVIETLLRNIPYIEITIWSIVTHLIFLYPIINIKKYFKPSAETYMCGVFCLAILVFLPYWPYVIKRNTGIISIILTPIICDILYKIIFTNYSSILS